MKKIIQSNKKFKVAILIQGDFRNDTNKVLKFYTSNFENVIFSTWEVTNLFNCEKFENLKIIKTKLPKNTGYTNRFLQRISTYQGLKYAKKIGCTHILKNRSDMIISNFKPIFWTYLLKITNKKIISTPYRCCTAKPDFLSSICDYFQFGEIDQIMNLWRCENLNLNGELCLPEDISIKELEMISSKVNPILYCAESELYALLRDSPICKRYKLYNHKKIIRELFLLIPIHLFGIIWFDDKSKFRILVPASEHPWWSILNYFLEPTIFKPNYKYKAFLSLSIRKNLVKLIYLFDIFIQKVLSKLILINFKKQK